MQRAAEAGQQQAAGLHGRAIAQIAAQLADTTRKEREAACQQITDTLTKEHILKRKQLQDDFAEERTQIHMRHKAKMKEAKEMTCRWQNLSKQLSYIVRGCEQAALADSVPCQIFEAKPDSMLNRILVVLGLMPRMTTAALSSTQIQRTGQRSSTG